MERKTTAVVDLSHKLLHTCKDDPDRLKDSAFTRERKLGAERMLHMLLHRLAGPLQLGRNAPDCHRRNRYSAEKQRGTQARFWLFWTEAGMRQQHWVLWPMDPGAHNL